MKNIQFLFFNIHLNVKDKTFCSFEENLMNRKITKIREKKICSFNTPLSYLGYIKITLLQPRHAKKALKCLAINCLNSKIHQKQTTQSHIHTIAYFTLNSETYYN